MNALFYVVTFGAYCFLFAAVTGEPVSSVVAGSLPTFRTVG